MGEMRTMRRGFSGLLWIALGVILTSSSAITSAYAAGQEITEATRLKQEQNPGIVIGEPVAENADADTTTFGVGCGRWLFWAVGGLPQMGSTPSWSEVNRAEARLKRQDLRISPTEAAQMAHYLGVNRIATGKISGNAQNCTLTYQLFYAELPLSPGDQPQLKAQGAPLSAMGSYEQIIDQLPEMAREIAVRSGVPNPQLPEQVGTNAVGLVSTGAVQSEGTITAENRDTFLRLAHDFPLANLMVGLYDNQPPSIEQAVAAHFGAARNFLLQSPQNIFGWGELSVPGEDDAEEYEKLFLQNQKKFPNNYQLARAMISWKQEQEDYASALEYAENAVAASPFNPYAHMSLADAISEQANSVRQGRFFNAMTRQEQATVRELYPQWSKAALAAVNRDTTHSEAWLALSTAQTFTGDRSSADEALWKAIETDPDNLAAYSWGLQIYQPKWHGDNDKLWKIAQAVMADESRLLNLYDQIFEAFAASHGQSKNAVEVRAKTVSALEKVLELAPDSAELHYDLGKILLDDITSPESKNDSQTRAAKVAKSRSHLERATVLNGEYAQAYFQLGRLMMGGFNLDFGKAEAALTRAAQLEPTWDEPAARLGELFEMKEDYAASEKWWRRAIRISPANGWHYASLAYAVLKQNRREEAVRLAEQAKKLGGGNGPVFEELEKSQPTAAT